MAEPSSSPQPRRSEVQVAFAEPQAHLRSMLRSSLRELGYTNVVDYSSMEEFREGVDGQFLDLLIIDTTIAGPRCDIIRDIRSGNLLSNPFTTIVVTTFTPDMDIVRGAVEAGTDDLLIKPLSPAKLSDRIRSVAFNRRPFVVTHDYIGPDRRRDRPVADTLPLISVPNTLGLKERGETVNTQEAEAIIAAARREINDQKLKRNAFQIAFLVGLILPDYDRGEPTSDTRRMIERLRMAAADIKQRMQGTPYEHVGQLCDSVVEVGNGLAARWRTPARKDLDLLKPLSDAMVVAFNPETDGGLLAAEVGSAIRGYRMRKKT